MTWALVIALAASVVISTMAIETARYWHGVADRPTDEIWAESHRELARGYAARDLRTARIWIAVGIVALVALIGAGW